MASMYDDPNRQQPYQPPKPPSSTFDQPTWATPVGQGPPVEVKRRSGCTCVGCLLGCFGLTIVLTILGGIGAWWGVKQIPDVTRNFLKQAIDETDLPPEDKQMVMKQVDRLVDGYKQGKVDMQKLGQLGENFVQSPLMDLMIAYAAKKKYIEPSGLSDEEKANAERVLQRLARGVVEKKIADDELDVALNHISNEVGNGGRQFRETVSDAELRAFLKECQRLADEAEIPDDEYQIDVGAELKKLVDEALGEVSEVEAPLPAEKPEPPSAPLPPAEKPDAERADETSAEKTEQPFAEQPAPPPAPSTDKND